MDEPAIHHALSAFNLGKMLEALTMKDGQVQVTLTARRDEVAGFAPLAGKITAALENLPGVQKASVVFTAHQPPPAPAPAQAANLLPGVKKIIAVASGKGGVGKSTVAVNLAVALQQTGLKIGLLDADIYGPSLPRMLGLNAKPQVKDGIIQPLHAWGLACMSIGFMVAEETAMVWRGPMVMGALNQMLGQVAWGELDILVVDMPPGTGDAQLTLSQKVPLAGAVVVSTPQDIALIDARRGVRMFEQVGVKVLGIVENMSYFSCPHCGERAEIFGHGGAQAEAARTGVAFLGAVPLLLDIREAGDAGTPVSAAAPESKAGLAFRAIAAAVQQSLQSA